MADASAPDGLHPDRPGPAVALPLDRQDDLSQRYDFQIHDAADQRMWSWAQDRMFLQALRREEIAAGGTHVVKGRFFGLLPPGSYRVTARLTAREATLPAVAGFTVE